MIIDFREYCKSENKDLKIVYVKRNEQGFLCISILNISPLHLLYQKVSDYCLHVFIGILQCVKLPKPKINFLNIN